MKLSRILFILSLTSVIVGLWCGFLCQHLSIRAHRSSVKPCSVTIGPGRGGSCHFDRLIATVISLSTSLYGWHPVMSSRHNMPKLQTSVEVEANTFDKPMRTGCMSSGALQREVFESVSELAPFSD